MLMHSFILAIQDLLDILELHPRLAMKDKIGHRELIGKLENVMRLYAFVFASNLIFLSAGSEEGFQHQCVSVGSKGSQGTGLWVAVRFSDACSFSKSLQYRSVLLLFAITFVQVVEASIEKLKEKKVTLRTPLIECLDAIALTVWLSFTCTLECLNCDYCILFRLLSRTTWTRSWRA